MGTMKSANSLPTSDGAELQSAIVFCRIRSGFTGARLVSLPFSDHCDPLVASPDDLAVLNRTSAALADAAGVLGVDPGAATLAELEAREAAREAALGARRSLRRLAGAS